MSTELNENNQPLENNNTVNNNSENNTSIKPKLTYEEMEDALKTVRDENGNRRKKLKTAESMLKDLLGIEAETEVNDWTKLIQEHKTSAANFEQSVISKATEKANARLLEAEFKVLENDYDTKLLRKLVDTKKVDFNDESKDISEQFLVLVKEVETEFPAVKKSKEPVTTGTGVHLNPTDTVVDEYNELYKKAKETKSSIDIRNLFIRKEKGK
jgi:hypothetical protein